MKGHGRIYRLRRLPWDICAGCGLVFLNNPISRWCAERGCNYEDSPAYAEAFRRLTQ